MTGPFADKLFRIAFALAGCYNLAFGIWAGFWPLAFFEMFGLEPPRYPGIWACLGMVVGVYGLLYWHAAWKLESGWPIIAVGLLGKLLGPLGMALSFSDAWPRRIGMLCIYNDLIWWLPFGLFLMRGTWIVERLARLAPWICAAMHAVALAVVACVLRPGTIAVTDVAERCRYVAEHATAWPAAWSVWMLAAMSLVGFYAWWGSQLAEINEQGARSRHPIAPRSVLHAPCSSAAIAGVLLAACGLVFDLSGEGLSIFTLVERAQAIAGAHAPALSSTQISSFTDIERTITLLTAGASNLLYTLGGIVLTLATPDLPRAVRAVMWATWLAGLAMTLAALANHVGGMIVTTAILFPLLIAWTTWMGALEAGVIRVTVLDGLGLFGRAAVEQLRALGIPAQTASRSSGADLRVDADDAVSIRAAFAPGDVVIDAAGPFHMRSMAVVEAAIDMGFDLIDLNDDLGYAEKVLALAPRIDAAGICVLSSASSVSAVSAAVVRQSGVEAPVSVASFLVPASRHTANAGTALSLLRSVGQPVRFFRDGRLKSAIGWSESRQFPMPAPLGTVRSWLFEAADAIYLPHIWPTLRDVSMYVDSNTPGANSLLRLAAKWPLVRGAMKRNVELGAALARCLGSATGGIGYEIEDAEGKIRRYAIVAAENSFLAAVAPAVLAARAIVESRSAHRGLVMPDRHVEPRDLFAYLKSHGITLNEVHSC